MLRRIVLENFMSHARTVIEPAEGLTVLVGPNNCGKSAVVSALQTLCTNLSGDYMVRHGQRDSRVTVETDDGHIVTWKRSGATVTYVIDGEEISRLRGGVPDRLHQLLRLPEVRSTENSEDEFDIHFGTQKSPIFLLNEPERRAAMFFAASSDAALLLQMQKRHSDKVRDSKRQRESLEKDRVRLDRELSALLPVPQLSDRLRQIELEYDSVTQGIAQLASLTDLASTLAREATSWDLHTAELNVLGRLLEPYQPLDTGPLHAAIRQFEATNERVGFETRQLAAVSPLRDLPVLEDATAIALLADNIALEVANSQLAAGVARSLDALAMPPELTNFSDLDLLVSQLAGNTTRLEWDHKATQAVRCLEEPPQLSDCNAVEKLTGELARAIGQVSEAAQCFEVLNPLRDAPRPDDYSPLAQLIAQIEECRAATTELSQTLNSCNEESAEVVQSIRRWAEQNQICNVCGAPLDADRLIHEHPYE